MNAAHDPGPGVSHSVRRLPGWVRWATVPVVAGLVVLGVWATGALVTEDFGTAQVLTGLFLAGAGLVAAWVAWRRRELAWPVLGTFVVVAGTLSVWLLVTSTRDVTVEEDVVVAAQPSAGASLPEGSAGPTGSAGPVALAAGPFVGVAHETTGTATVVGRPDGTRVLTLTDLATDPGPDVRVYLVPGDGTSLDGGVDIGALKGNIGNQQYAVPAGLAAGDVGAVVLWCRAFSVSFGYATLVAA